ncbi:hypothetical protein KSP39_PZI019278 [Platanthera zijinensis]|uniref:Uncharacterized protein n=1 Tax=Platanthera zijinensis TaxID=2320716 RepID=A0AAP0B1P0_9ASPA
MGRLKVEALMIILLFAVGLTSLADLQSLVEAKKQSPKWGLNASRKETMPWWWPEDYSCARKRRHVHNSLDP